MLCWTDWYFLWYIYYGIFFFLILNWKEKKTFYGVFRKDLSFKVYSLIWKEIYALWDSIFTHLFFFSFIIAFFWSVNIWLYFYMIYLYVTEYCFDKMVFNCKIMCQTQRRWFFSKAMQKNRAIKYALHFPHLYAWLSKWHRIYEARVKLLPLGSHFNWFHLIQEHYL